MNIIYAGTPQYVVPPMQSVLEAGHNISLVITPPDVVRGRGQEETSPPLKRAALERGLHVYQPESINNENAVERIEREEPDVIVVASFGKILTPDVLDIPSYEAINIHPSLLPTHRGPAPVAHAILQGDQETGVTIFKMNEELDSGPIIEQETTSIEPDETTGDLRERLFRLSADLLPDVLESIYDGSATYTQQNEEEATYASLLSKEDGRLRWNEPAEVIDRKVRAFQPWPRAFSWLDIQHREDDTPLRMNIYQGYVEDTSEDHDAEPGRIVRTNGELAVQAGEETYVIERLQPENKSPMDASDFVNGYQVQEGDQFLEQPSEG